MMKVRMKNSKTTVRSDGSKFKTSGFCSMVVYFVSLVVLCFVTPLAGAEISSGRGETNNSFVSHPNGVGMTSTNLVARVDEKLPQGGFTLPKDPNNRLTRQLWQARISIPQGEKDTEGIDELSRLIAQIRSIEFKPKKKTSEPAITVEPAPAAQKDETLEDANAPEESEIKKIEPKLPFEPVTDSTLQMLKTLLQDPNSLRNPFELAEILFLSGNLTEAAMFYQVALSHRDSDKDGTSTNRAWILFQMGNCLRSDDPTKAEKMYTQLITECPDSPWTDLAKVQATLLGWYRKDDPWKLISEHKL